MTKREKIRNLFGGKCAYCGKDLGKTFHADHIEPVERKMKWGDDKDGYSRLVATGEYRYPERDSASNIFPSCPRCNLWKGIMNIEQFRNEIRMQVERSRAYSKNFRLAEDYGLVKETKEEVVFWFEKYREGGAA
jgi:5-methylcytosine-specific restriction endonuclease McrA